MKTATTIDEVITLLDEIIETSISTSDPIGYFVALYRKVTVAVKEGIANNTFENGPRMERLDVIFANRFIEAYFDNQEKKATTKSWAVAFEMAKENNSIVLQQLMIGMNAHINLDLGIAAAEVSRGEDINDLQNDFNKINEVLSSLVEGVEEDLSRIWPTLGMLLQWSGDLDDKITDFSMTLARNGAWKFAKELAELPEASWQNTIAEKDKRVAKNVKLINPSAWPPRFILTIIKWGEKGTVQSRIKEMEN